MYSDINQLCETFKDLSREDYYNAIAALENVRLTNVRQALQYHKTMDALRKEYLGERRAIIGEKNLEEFRHFRLKQSKNMRAIEDKLCLSQDTAEAFEKERAKMEEGFEHFAANLGISSRQLSELRETHRQKRITTYYQTVGKGEKSEPMENISTSKDADPEFFPPYMGYSEFDPYDLVSEWHNNSRGTMGANMRCNLYDCGEHDSRYATYRRYWLMFGPAERSGRLLATIDLNPTHFYSLMTVRDEPGQSGVDITRHFKAFAQLAMPWESERFYFNDGERDQIIWNDREAVAVGGPRTKLPFHRREEGRVLHRLDSSSEIELLGGVYFTGTPQGGRTWRYQMLLPGDIRRGSAVLALVGIDFYNSVWGDDCTAQSVITFEFSTPRISFEVV